MPNPLLSVVVIILQGGNSLRNCLRELEKQARALPMEILVPCDESFDGIAAFRTEFPQVKFIEVKGHRTFAELRTVGVQKGQGEIVGVTEDQCRPCPTWCEEVINLHQSPHATVGGAVEKDVPDSTVGWALFFADYVRYMNPIAEGSSHHLTDCNVSYKRSALLAISSVWEKEFHEPDVHGALQARGESLWFSPKMVVYQKRSMTLGEALKDRYNFGRLFGSGRVVSASLFRRLFLSGAALLLPLLTVFRVAQNVFRKRRHYGQFLRALPVLILLNSVWAGGECVGYLTGRAAPALTPGQRNVPLVGSD